MHDKLLPDGYIEKDGVMASSGYLGPVPSDDGLPTVLEISRLRGNGDWSLNMVGSNQYVHGLRFTTGFGSGDSLFVGDELYALLERFRDKIPGEISEKSSDEIYAPEAVAEVGGEHDSFTLRVNGMEGLGHVGEMFSHIQRLLDITVNRDGSTNVTIRNRKNPRAGEEVLDDEEVPETATTMIFKPDGKFPLMSQTFALIAQRAAAAINRRSPEVVGRKKLRLR